MKQKFLVTLLLLLFSTKSFAIPDDEKIITVHGFLGSPWNLYYFNHVLENEKLIVEDWSYPSREKKIQEHAEDLVSYLKQEAAEHPGKTIHFLTHSMGGLILRAALNHHECPNEAKIGRAVLLAPPNGGATWGRYVGKWKLASIIGKDQAGKELMTEHTFDHLGSFPEKMKVMVIAGDLSFNPWLPGDNDGTVTVEETYLSTPHEHFVIHAEHHLILVSKQAARLTKDFFLYP